MTLHSEFKFDEKIGLGTETITTQDSVEEDEDDYTHMFNKSFHK